MAKRKKLYAKWGKGGLEITISPGLISVVARNAAIHFEPRSITVEADYQEPIVESNGRRNYAYIGFRQALEPLEAPRIDIIGRYVGEYAEIRATSIEGLGDYLTIITPGEYLYDYAVITPEKLLFQTNAKKKIFFERTGIETIIAYIA